SLVGSINNQLSGLFAIQNDQAMNYSSATRPTLTNSGTVRKSVTTGATTINWSLNNAAGSVVDVQTGTLVVAGGGVDSGATFKPSAGATLTFSNPYTFPTTDAFVNQGVTNFNAGTATIGAVSGTGTLAVAGGATVTASRVSQNS